MHIAKRNGFFAILGGFFLAGGICLFLQHKVIIGTALLIPGLIAYGFLVAWRLKRPH